MTEYDERRKALDRLRSRFWDAALDAINALDNEADRATALAALADGDDERVVEIVVID